MCTINYKLTAFLMLTSLLGSGCADEDVLQNAGSFPNSGIISQRHFFIGLDPVAPKVVDLVASTIDLNVTVAVTITIGDRYNQLITEPHTVYFETEWGLIEPSCTTDETGQCSVTWRPTSFIDYPVDLSSVIVAYTTGEEGFGDLNNNGTFDDGEDFIDLEEPWINTNSTENPPVYDLGVDIIIDTINGNDLTGKNLAHDIPDGFFNGPGCTHSSLCSTVLRSTTVWDAIDMGFAQ